MKQTNLANDKGADQTTGMRRLVCVFVVSIQVNRVSQDVIHP